MSNPKEIRFPGHMATTVGDASDRELKDCLEKDLQAIAAVLADYDLRPDAQGMAPESWKANVSRAQENNLFAVERTEQRVVAIRDEIKERKEKAKADAIREQKDVRGRLERVLTEAPKQARQLHSSTPEIIEASNRVRQFIADLQLMAGSVTLPQTMQTLTGGAEQAARALDKPVPEIPGLPDGLPTRSEVTGIIALLAGRGDGFSQRHRVPVEDASKVQELVRKLA